MSVSKKGPIVDPGLCRCCGMIKKCRLLNFEYEWTGKKEVYSDMFVDCFGLVLSHLDNEESKRLICATCVVRLRDAYAFRLQVLACEEQLLKATVHIHEEEEYNKIKVEVLVKEEVSQEPSQNVVSDGIVCDDLLTNDSDDDYGDVTTDPTYEPMDTEPKTESSLTEDVHKKIKSRCLRPRPVDGVVNRKHETTLEKDIHVKLKRMRDKLKKKIRKEPSIKTIIQPECIQPTIKRPPAVDKEFNTLKNALTIIENSYVTPFVAIFSDYHCFYCREMFLEPDKLRQHTLEHDPRTYQEFMNNKKMTLVDIVRIDCRLCQAEIDNIDSFKDHITSIHNKVIYKDVDSEFIKFRLKTGKLNCVECDKPFKFFQALKKHMAEHFGTFICDVCGAHYFEERHLVFHKNTHNINRNVEMFPCPECEKTFRSKNSRNFHIARIHKNEAAYSCNKCDEVFISYHMRYRHKMHVHGEKREFPCENCDKVYDCRKTLREHYQRIHLQLLRHECSLCDKKFYLPSALRDHMTTHTGERLYHCDYCGKNYPRKKALKVHLQSHNTEKKYKCSLCPCSYTQANNFKNHMKSKHPMPPEYNEGYG